MFSQDEHKKQSESKISISSMILILSIFAVALVMRIYSISKSFPGLYNDELYVSLSAYAQLYHISYLTVPGYNIRDWLFYFVNGYILSLVIFGHTVFSSRFPVAIYGSLIVFPVYLVSLELTDDREISLVAAFIWTISPSAVVTSRVGYGVEITPLFYFLLLVLFALKYYRTRKRIYFLPILLLLLLFVYFPSFAVWAIFPAIFLIVSIAVLTFSENQMFKNVLSGLRKYVVAFVASFVIIWFATLLAWNFPYQPVRSYLNNVIPLQYVLPSRPLAFFIFIERLLSALSPFKIFWISEFTGVGLDYESPVFVPFIFSLFIPFIAIFIYFTVRRKYISQWRRSSLYFLYILAFAGLFEPLFNLTNPAYYFEPSEGIFVFPFISIMAASGVVIAFRKVYDVEHKRIAKVDRSREGRSILNIVYHRKFTALFLAFILLFGGLNFIAFMDDLYGSSIAYYENNNTTLYCPFYGWSQVSEVMVAHNLYKETLYYVPGSSSFFSASNPASLNYWFYHQHFPLYWLYYYSGGKITSIGLLYPQSLPSIGKYGTIILSQDPNYTKILRQIGITYELLYTVYRQDGIPAIEIINVTPPNLTQQTLSYLRESDIFAISNYSKSYGFDVPGLSNITGQFTVSVNFTMPEVPAGTRLSILSTGSSTFSVGVWSSNYLGNTGPDANDTFYAEGTVYTNHGNYSSPNSWARIWASEPLVPGDNYLLTLTYDNGTMDLYLNDTLMMIYQLGYPLYPPGDILEIDSSVAVHINQAAVWDTTLNVEEIDYLLYNGFDNMVSGFILPN